MHIPDGFLTPAVFAPAWIASAGVIVVCVKKVQNALKERAVPLMGMSAAFIFAAQMLNFPVLGGTSGHLIGGVLAAVLLGPYAGVVVVSIVLIVQAVFFQDGGVATLGANIFNMALVGSGASYFIFAGVRRILRGRAGAMIAVAVASWASVVLAAVCCAIELALSGTAPIKVVLPAMAGIHAFIGVGEAIITTLIVGLIARVRPDMLYEGWSATKKDIIIGLAVAVVVVVAAVFFSSSLPDGLETVLEKMGLMK
jgi:cobalt/nickel transport system permease protein